MNNIEILEKAKNIKLLACDVDGVLTHGEIIIFNNGDEVKIWNVKDGMGYNLLSKTSPRIKTAWITGRGSVQVETRAAEIKIDYLIQNCMSKKEALVRIAEKENLDLSQIAYIGDDIVDVPVLKSVGLSSCPSDACADAKEAVSFVSALNGGDGVVREMIEIIIKALGEWKKVLERYEC
ncbi:KdsC family phosphatase [Candidatus Endomicrobiellum devescovinae]|jgi:3-deoxy-D-manno-octulosonate 8-phosphate phosphatase (KDO 8-P phosphatase)|uniref:KdsC family phosphatase n=1 Tax=Candidatus Endomicrobiellum devescovinae TaxID=3242322 RepID=UPI0028320863|nr:HAD hydrolase family protein [Endomicrobium sp.]MDR1434502.1 HAD hydrolase family protein [Endomicrobium sp.]MDR2818893.1 HAD hydrolase family protein [Endomicrobium sp.]